MEKQNVIVTILKDSTVSQKNGQHTAYATVEKKNGIFISTLATGFIKLAQEVKKGDSFPMELETIDTRVGATPITVTRVDLNGREFQEDVMPEWLVLK